MAVDAAYLDGDAYPSIYITHPDNELNRLYRNLGKDHFRDVTIDAGLGAERRLRSGFGVRFADFDTQLMGGTSYCSASARRLHFGLGAAQIVKRVEVRWPSGHVDSLQNLPANRVHQVIERARVQ